MSLFVSARPSSVPLIFFGLFLRVRARCFSFYPPWRSMTSWSIALSLALHDYRVFVLGLFLFQHHHLSMQRTFTFTHPRPFNAAHVHVHSSASIQCSARTSTHPRHVVSIQFTFTYPRQFSSRSLIRVQRRIWRLCLSRQLSRRSPEARAASCADSFTRGANCSEGEMS